MANSPPLDSFESTPMASEPESDTGLNPSVSKAISQKGEIGGGGGSQAAIGGGDDGDMEQGQMGKDGDGEGGGDTVSTKRGDPKNGCQRCCGKIMSFFANDAIYGSFVGPHPVSFFCMCHPCKKCISRACATPLCVASLVTKAMNFIMLLVVTLLSCFFIFPWFKTGASKNDTDIESFWPCDGKNTIPNQGENGGCVTHAGYYMAYRCFLAFAIVMLTNCFAMADVTSTKDDPYRKRIHHGFWMYKYIYLMVLILIFFMFLHGSHDSSAYFEYTMSIIGNLAHVVFSFFELTIILDIIEMWVVTVHQTNNGWANFVYCLVTVVIFIVDLVALLVIFFNFAFPLKFDILELKNKSDVYDKIVEKSKGDLTLNEVYTGATADDKKFLVEVLKKFQGNVTFSPKWPFTNCLDGSYIEMKNGGFFGWKIEGMHFGMICGTIILVTFLILVMGLKQRFMTSRYPFQGWLQVALITSFDVFYLWSALFNSELIHSRPRCNWALNWYAHLPDIERSPTKALQAGSHDTYFRFTGFFHGLIVAFTLVYFAFVHGPRSKTAPLSLGYRHFFAGGYDRLPVYPDPEKAPAEFVEAVEKLEVWDDEQEKVAQNWSHFYLMMVFGSLSLMMSMTNFTDPWAAARYNSSKLAMGFKYITSIGVTFAYIFFLVCPCTRVYRAYEAPAKIRRRRVKKAPVQKEGMEEVEQEETFEIIEDIEEDDGQAWY